MNSEPLYVSSDSAKWVTYQKVKEDGRSSSTMSSTKTLTCPWSTRQGNLFLPTPSCRYPSINEPFL